MGIFNMKEESIQSLNNALLKRSLEFIKLFGNGKSYRFTAADSFSVDERRKVIEFINSLGIEISMTTKRGCRPETTVHCTESCEDIVAALELLLEEPKTGTERTEEDYRSALIYIMSFRRYFGKDISYNVVNDLMGCFHMEAKSFSDTRDFFKSFGYDHVIGYSGKGVLRFLGKNIREVYNVVAQKYTEQFPENSKGFLEKLTKKTFNEEKKEPVKKVSSSNTEESIFMCPVGFANNFGEPIMEDKEKGLALYKCSLPSVTKENLEDYSKVLDKVTFLSPIPTFVGKVIEYNQKKKELFESMF